jgi:predicted DNA-binding transcriptional regulator YafY
MIAADANTPLERVRRKLEETFGQFERDRAGTPGTGSVEEDLVTTLAEGIRDRRLVELEYLKEEEDTPTPHLVEPYHLERRLPYWYVHTWDRTRGAERSFRLDRMRSARLTDERFESRPGFQLRGLQGAVTAQIWYSPAIARWRLERGGARELADGSALADTAVGSPEWLVSEIFHHRGEAVVLEPADLRRRVATRARELGAELGVTRARARTA